MSKKHLTKKEREEVVKMVENKVKKTVIARAYNINRRTVSRIFEAEKNSDKKDLTDVA